MKKLFFYSFFLLLAFVGCTQVVPEDLESAIQFAEPMEEFKINSSGGTNDVEFFAKEDWMVEVSAVKSALDWCEAYPESGPAGAASFSLNIKPNRTSKSRSAEITIKAGDSKHVIAVLQNAGMTSPIIFDDENLHLEVCSILDKSAQDAIYTEDLLPIKELNLSSKKISAMTDLRHFYSLESLDCSNNDMTDLPLAYDALANLKEVKWAGSDNLKRIWVNDSAAVGSRLKIEPLDSSMISILASPNRFEATSEGAEFEMYLRPGVTDIEAEEEYTWMRYEPVLSEEKGDTVAWKIIVDRVIEDKTAILSVSDTTETYGIEKEWIVINAGLSYSENVDSTALDWSIPGEVHVAELDLKDDPIPDEPGPDTGECQFYLSIPEAPELIFDPNLRTFALECGVLRNGMPVRWTISGDGFVFAKESGEGIMTMNAMIDGNPRTKSCTRYIILRSGTHSHKYEIRQDGVYFEPKITDNRSMYDYIPKNEPKERPTIFMPPQKSTAHVEYKSNAHYAGWDGDYMLGEQYRNDVSPTITVAQGAYNKNLVIDYPANANAVAYDKYDSLFEQDVPMLDYKRRGVKMTFRPMIAVIDWTDMTIKYSKVKDNFDAVVEDKFNLIQLAVELRDKAHYYLSYPTSYSYSPSVYLYDDKAEALNTSLIDFQSNVDWVIDVESLEKYGIVLTSSNVSSKSDGFSLERKQFEMSFKDRKLSSSTTYDGFQSVYRTSGYQASTVVPFPILMDLKDDSGYSYSIYPGWIGHCGVPGLSISFNTSPWGDMVHYDMKYPASDYVHVKYSVSVDLTYDKIQKIMKSQVLLFSNALYMRNLVTTDDYGHTCESEPIAFGSYAYPVCWEAKFSEVDHVEEILETQVAHDAAVYFGEGHPIYAKSYIDAEGKVISPRTDFTTTTSGDIVSPMATPTEMNVNNVHRPLQPVGLEHIRRCQFSSASVQSTGISGMAPVE